MNTNWTNVIRYSVNRKILNYYELYKWQVLTIYIPYKTKKTDEEASVGTNFMMHKWHNCLLTIRTRWFHWIVSVKNRINNSRRLTGYYYVCLLCCRFWYMIVTCSTISDHNISVEDLGARTYYHLRQFIRIEWKSHFTIEEGVHNCVSQLWTLERLPISLYIPTSCWYQSSLIVNGSLPQLWAVDKLKPEQCLVPIVFRRCDIDVSCHVLFIAGFLFTSFTTQLADRCKSLHGKSFPCQSIPPS